jgi:hypothetical protein
MFAIIALLTGLGESPMDIFCSSGQRRASLSGMVTMHLLMSAFHSAGLAEPDLRLIRPPKPRHVRGQFSSRGLTDCSILRSTGGRKCGKIHARLAATVWRRQAAYPHRWTSDCPMAALKGGFFDNLTT